jgi:hypothetical protein
MPSSASTSSPAAAAAAPAIQDGPPEHADMRSQVAKDM